MIARRVLAMSTLMLVALTACGQEGSTTIRLSEFEIKPQQFSVIAGRPLTLTLINNGRIRHNLEFDPAVTTSQLPTALGPGEKATISFTPIATGAFAYWCSIPGHNTAGMVGTLTVNGS
jgi:uncharacterized cupredoxin-like copper-binding protein